MPGILESISAEQTFEQPESLNEKSFVKILLTCYYSVPNKHLCMVNLLSFLNNTQLGASEAPISIIEDLDFSVSTTNHYLIQLWMPKTSNDALKKKLQKLLKSRYRLYFYSQVEEKPSVGSSQNSCLFRPTSE